jgi:hypothetical protein
MLHNVCPNAKNSGQDATKKKVVKFVGPKHSRRERDDRHRVRNAVIVDIGNWTQRFPMCQWTREVRLQALSAAWTGTLQGVPTASCAVERPGDAVACAAHGLQLTAYVAQEGAKLRLTYSGGNSFAYRYRGEDRRSLKGFQ